MAGYKTIRKFHQMRTEFPDLKKSSILGDAGVYVSEGWVLHRSCCVCTWQLLAHTAGAVKVGKSHPLILIGLCQTVFLCLAEQRKMGAEEYSAIQSSSDVDCKRRREGQRLIVCPPLQPLTLIPQRNQQSLWRSRQRRPVQVGAGGWGESTDNQGK